jgi:nicotinamidase-related amidase
MKSALLVIDMQKKFYFGRTKDLMDSASFVINSMIDKFRNKNYPIIWIQHESRVLGLIKNTESFGIIENLKPKAEDERIVKTKMNSYIKTGLKDMLDKNGISNIVVCGYAAEFCVINTYKGSLKLNYQVTSLKDGIASGSKSAIKKVEKRTNAKSIDEIVL